MPSPRARWTLMCLETVCVIVAISLLFPTLLSAQGASGRILGRVADPTGAVLSGAKITLLNEATGISRDAKTNDSGDFSFVEVVPGTYTVQFELTGFKKNVQKSVIVDVNQVVTLNSTLQIGGSQETVEVTSEAPQVDTTSTQLGACLLYTSPVEATSPPLCRLGKTSDSLRRFAHQNGIGGRELQLNFIQRSPTARSPHHQHQPVARFHTNQFCCPMKRLVADRSANAYACLLYTSPALALQFV